MTEILYLQPTNNLLMRLVLMIRLGELLELEIYLRDPGPIEIRGKATKRIMEILGILGK